MWTTEATRTTTAAKEQIWKLWTDVSHWNVWDKDVEFSELSGPFQTGAKGMLKTAGGPKTKFTITECTAVRSFTNTTVLPLCRMEFTHTMTESKGGLEVVHTVTMTGLLTFFFSRVIGGKLRTALPAAVENLIETAEKAYM